MTLTLSSRLGIVEAMFDNVKIVGRLCLKQHNFVNFMNVRPITKLNTATFYIRLISVKALSYSDL